VSRLSCNLTLLALFGVAVLWVMVESSRVKMPGDTYDFGR
jgi:hypothetical protein